MFSKQFLNDSRVSIVLTGTQKKLTHFFYTQSELENKNIVFDQKRIVSKYGLSSFNTPFVYILSGTKISAEIDFSKIENKAIIFEELNASVLNWKKG